MDSSKGDVTEMWLFYGDPKDTANADYVFWETKEILAIRVGRE